MTHYDRLLVCLFAFFFLGVAIGAVSVWTRNQETKDRTMAFKYDLGAKVTDKITGYTGMIIARTEWLYSCKRYVVQARELKDGKPVDNIGCDEDQLDLVEAPEVKHVMRETGGPMPAPTRNPDATR